MKNDHKTRCKTKKVKFVTIVLGSCSFLGYDPESRGYKAKETFFKKSKGNNLTERRQPITWEKVCISHTSYKKLISINNI